MDRERIDVSRGRGIEGLRGEGTRFEEPTEAEEGKIKHTRNEKATVP
jgi:hypothetical protein